MRWVLVLVLVPVPVLRPRPLILYLLVGFLLSFSIPHAGCLILGLLLSYAVRPVTSPLEPAVQRSVWRSFVNRSSALQLFSSSDLFPFFHIIASHCVVSSSSVSPLLVRSFKANPRFLWDLLSAPLSGSITPVVDQPTYTFIDHDDDLCSKKIKNSSSRKAIRSHVMRDVRRRERLAGLKRGTKRDTQEKRSQPNVASKPVEDSSTERTSACWTTSPSSSSTSSSSTIEEFEAGSDLLMSRPIWQQQQQQQQQSTSWSADYSSTVLSPTANVQPNTTTWFPAPQRPMRSADCIPTVVVELIYYCKSCLRFSLPCVCI